MSSYDYCEPDAVNIISYRNIEEKFVGEISWVETPSEFYVNVIKGEEWENYMVLWKSMQRFYKENSSKCYLTNPSVGQLVAAKVDGKCWQRGLIKKIRSNDKYDVFIIDSGFLQIGIHDNDVRLLRYKYARACCAQAIPVKLAFIDPVKGFWSKEACSSLRKYMDKDLLIKTVSMELTKESNRYSIMIFDDNRCIVTPNLVKSGYAQFTEESVIQKIAQNY